MSENTDGCDQAKTCHSNRGRKFLSWHRQLRVAIGLCLLSAVAFGVYHPALHAQLVADDFSLVGQISVSEAMGYFHKTSGFGRNEYRPLTVMSYAIDRVLWHANPEGYHLTNLLLHTTTAGLWFLMVYSLSADFALALLGGLLFVIHPANHSRVVWISARDGSICAVFLVGALWTFIRSRQHESRKWCGIAVLLSACALLAYEGAIILPALIFVTEFLFFAQGDLGSRVGLCFRRTAPFWSLAATYLCLWLLMFHGKVGGYDLLLRPVTMAHNYVRLLSTLFYDARHWALALLYLLLFGSLYRNFRGRLRTTGLGICLVLIAFLPYCFTNGFAYRFAYISALGMSLLLALCILGGLRSHWRLCQAATAGLGIALCTWYILEDRKILADWVGAGQVAAQIPQAVRQLHPHLPAGAVLVFTGIPSSYGKAYVFPTGLEAAIQLQYPHRIFVRQYDRAPTDLSDQARNGALVFQYHGGEEPLREVPPARGTALGNASQ